MKNPFKKKDKPDEYDRFSEKIKEVQTLLEKYGEKHKITYIVNRHPERVIFELITFERTEGESEELFKIAGYRDGTVPETDYNSIRKKEISYLLLYREIKEILK